MSSIAVHEADDRKQTLSINGSTLVYQARRTPSTTLKTPVSFLQEICSKRGLTPQYELIKAEGQVSGS